MQNTLYKEGMEKGIEQGIKQGKNEGIKERSIEIAKRLLEKGMTHEEISSIADLSIEEISKLVV